MWTIWHCHAPPVGYKMGQPLWNTTWLIPKKLNTESPQDPVISLLDIHPKNYKHVFRQILIPESSEQHDSEQPKGRNHPNVHQRTNG